MTHDRTLSPGHRGRTTLGCGSDPGRTRLGCGWGPRCPFRKKDVTETRHFLCNRGPGDIKCTHFPHDNDYSHLLVTLAPRDSVDLHTDGIRLPNHL